MFFYSSSTSFYSQIYFIIHIHEIYLKIKMKYANKSMWYCCWSMIYVKKKFYFFLILQTWTLGIDISSNRPMEKKHKNNKKLHDTNRKKSINWLVRIKGEKKMIKCIHNSVYDTKIGEKCKLYYNLNEICLDFFVDLLFRWKIEDFLFTWCMLIWVNTNMLRPLHI